MKLITADSYEWLSTTLFGLQNCHLYLQIVYELRFQKSEPKD